MAVITASPKNFVRLIELQETANQNLDTIRSLLEVSRNVQVATLVENTRIDDDGDRLEKLEKESLDIEKENLKIQKEQLKILKESEAERKQAQEAIQKVMDGMKSFKSPLERMRDTMKGITSKFSGENIKKKLLESFGGNLRLFVIGGAPMNKETEAFLMKIHFPFTVGYGMTECGPLISVTEHFDEFKPSSCGRWTSGRSGFRCGPWRGWGRRGSGRCRCARCRGRRTGPRGRRGRGRTWRRP